MPYERPPLSKSSIVSDEEPSPTVLLDRAMAVSLDIDVQLSLTATKVNRTNKSVTLSDGSVIFYNKLVFATGAKPRVLAIPGGENAITLRDFDDACKVRTAFSAGQSIVIVGAGFVGLELAASAITRGCNVTVIARQERILTRGVPENIARFVQDRHIRSGVRFLTRIDVVACERNWLTLSDGQKLMADCLIAGIGASPSIELAERAGLEIDNGISCNSKLQTSDPDIFAAGDCCSFVHELFGNIRLRLEVWRNANDQAQTVASNLLGHHKPHLALPWFWSDQYEYSMQIAGLPKMGPITITRNPSYDSIVNFHLDERGMLVGVSGIGLQNSIARDVKVGEMMIGRRMAPSISALSDPNVRLKSLLHMTDKKT